MNLTIGTLMKKIPLAKRNTKLHKKTACSNDSSPCSTIPQILSVKSRTSCLLSIGLQILIFHHGWIEIQPNKGWQVLHAKSYFFKLF